MLDVCESYIISIDIASNGDLPVMEIARIENGHWQHVNCLKGMDALKTYELLTNRTVERGKKNE